MTKTSIDFQAKRKTLVGLRITSLRTALIALPLLLGACSVPDWADPTEWFGDEPRPTRVSTPDSSQGQTPKLSSVPSQAPQVSPAQQRDQLARGLSADRSNAEYTNEQLTGQSTAVPAAPPPAPLAPLPPAVTAAQNGATTPTAPAATQVPAPPPPAGSLPPAPPPPALPQTAAVPAAPQFDAPPSFAQPAIPARSELVAVIYFGHGSGNLNGNDRQVLRGVAALHKQRGGVIRVVGHASARTGTTGAIQHRMANFEVSLQRANTVAAELAALGVAQDKIKTESRSDEQPVYHEFMPTGEAGNRRTEIFLEY